MLDDTFRIEHCKAQIGAPKGSKNRLFLSFVRYKVIGQSLIIGVEMSFKRFKTNPFLEGMVITTKKRSVRLSHLGSDDNVLFNQVTGEIHGTHVTTYKKVDGAQFIKLFTANIALTFDLSSAGIKTFNVLLWVVQNHAISKDLVVLDHMMLDDFIAAQTKPLKLSLATFKRGLNELESAQIIAKSMRKSFYYINPNFVFNGDRIAFTTLIERRKDDDSSKQEDSKKQLELEVDNVE